MQYPPDLVILTFLAGNDFRNNSKFLNREILEFYLVSDDNGHLALDNSIHGNINAVGLPNPSSLSESQTTSYLLSCLVECVYLLRRQFRESRFGN